MHMSQRARVATTNGVFEHEQTVRVFGVDDYNAALDLLIDHHGSKGENVLREVCKALMLRARNKHLTDKDAAAALGVTKRVFSYQRRHGLFLK